MKLFLIFLALNVSLFGDLFNDKGEPKKPLISILDALYLPHNKSACSVYEATKVLLRKKDLNSRELSEKNLTYEQKTTILSALEELGFIGEVRTPSLEYDDVIIICAYGPDVQSRMQHLVHLYEKGLRFKRLFLLIRSRNRDSLYEPTRLFACPNKGTLVLKDIETEEGMTPLLWKHICKPKYLEEVELVVIKAEKRKVGHSNTYDALESLKKGGYDLEGKTYLAISSQPYVPYQSALLKRVLPPSYKGVTVGAAAKQKILFSQYLDTLARAVHNEFWIRHPECPPTN